MDLGDSWKSQFGWSRTAQNIWDDCKLQFYFQYISRYHKQVPPDKKRTIARLKRLNKFNFWKGQVVHDVIKYFLDINREKGEEVTRGTDLIRYFEEKAESDSTKFQETITEYHNGVSISRERVDEAIDDGRRQVHNFLELWPEYSANEYILHETLEQFLLGRPNIRVWAKCDLVTKDENGEILITDWKAGREEYEDVDTSDQIGAYILWAIAKRIADDPFAIKAEFVFLKNGRRKASRRTIAQLEELTSKIVKLTSTYFEVSHLNHLPPNPDKWRCVECNYCSLCKYGKRFVR